MRKATRAVERQVRGTPGGRLRERPGLEVEAWAFTKANPVASRGRRRAANRRARASRKANRG